MAAIDEAGVSRLGLFDPGPRVVGAGIERDRDDDEIVIGELLVGFLPDRQVIAASSPRGPGYQ